MSKRLTLIMTISVLAGFGILLLMNVASMMGYVPPKYISPNNVKSVSVEHNKVLITLNLNQQTALLDIFNRAYPITKEFAQSKKAVSAKPADVQKIIIYRLDGKDIEITPIGYVNKAALNPNAFPEPGEPFMVYYTPEWNGEGYMEEASAGELNKLLLTTYETK